MGMEDFMSSTSVGEGRAGPAVTFCGVEALFRPKHQHSNQPTGLADCLFYVNYCFGVPLLNGPCAPPIDAYRRFLLCYLANCLLRKAVNLMCSPSIIFISQRD
jgi:hypothetical protein